MAGMGPPPKPAHLRARTNRKAGASSLTAPATPRIPPIPNPDRRRWHRLTKASWQRAWESPMASQWLPTDVDGLGRLALLWDQFYQHPDAKVMAEIRLQEQRFGLSPLDRSRLQWEISKAEETEKKQAQRVARKTGSDPKAYFMSLVKR